MEKSSILYQTYLQILKKELVPAMGCTEPIAVAYCAAKARQVLGKLPDKVIVAVSGNIIKNVKSVVVPNTGGRRGLEVAAAVGIVAGDPDKGLEVISQVTEQQQAALADFIDSTPITVWPASSELVLDISIHLFAGEENATVRIINHHTGLTYIQHNGEVLFDEKPSAPTETNTLVISMILHAVLMFPMSKSCLIAKLPTTAPLQKKDSKTFMAPISERYCSIPTETMSIPVPVQKLPPAQTRV